MHITGEAEYALRIVNYLGSCEKRTDAAAISAAVGVTKNFCIKILHRLSECEIVRSFPGIGGGYELLIPPTELTLGQVVEAIDGPIRMLKCLQGDYVCSHMQDNKNDCRYHLLFDGISRAIRDGLYRITVEMVSGGEYDIEQLLQIMQQPK